MSYSFIQLILFDTGKKRYIHSKNAKVNSLASWSTMVVMATKDAVSLMDVKDTSINLSLPSMVILSVHVKEVS